MLSIDASLLGLLICQGKFSEPINKSFSFTLGSSTERHRLIKNFDIHQFPKLLINKESIKKLPKSISLWLWGPRWSCELYIYRESAESPKFQKNILMVVHIWSTFTWALLMSGTMYPLIEIFVNDKTHLAKRERFFA